MIWHKDIWNYIVPIIVVIVEVEISVSITGYSVSSGIQDTADLVELNGVVLSSVIYSWIILVKTTDGNIVK